MSSIQISVIIPCFNCKHTLDRTLTSLQKQKGVNIEIIAVEDGPEVSVKNTLKNYRNVKHHAHDFNKGASTARNTGLNIASGDYVLFLDADDELSEDYLANMYLIARETNANVTFGCVRKITSGKKVRSTFTPRYLENYMDVIKRCLLGNTGPGVHGILWEYDFINKIGGWNEELGRNDDGELLIRAMTFKPKIAQNYSGFGIYNLSTSASLSKKYDKRAFDAEYHIGKIIKSLKLVDLKDHYTVFEFITALRAKALNLDKELWWMIHENKWKIQKTNALKMRKLYLICYLTYRILGLKTSIFLYKNITNIIKK